MEDLVAQRQLMISIAEEGMATTEYMWLLIQIRRNGFGESWKDRSEIPDGKDDLALQAARNFFVIDGIPLISSTEFVADVKAKMLQPPYNCTDCDDIDPATSQVVELADSMLLYAIALNRSIAAGLPNPTGHELVHFALGSFQGFSGLVTINKNLTRDAVFLVYGLDSNDQQIVLMRITEDMTNISTSLIQDMQPASVVWAHHGGSPPLNQPLCDYDGSACPPSFAEKYLDITLIAIIVAIAIVIVAVALLLRYRRMKYERLNELWKVPFTTLLKRNTKDVIEKGTVQMDWFFKYSLIRDISEVKVTFFGLEAIKKKEIRKQSDYLWLAPEHIRDPFLAPTEMGDIYRDFLFAGLPAGEAILLFG
uniref:ANF_receptor domain-containing protein n=1 Tax=Angiostrongylus cantonensis TaxID=6313 RepID=A0A158P7I8_ANGCA